MRDVRLRDHLAPGLRVKIVEPKNEATGITTEGRIAEILTREEFDPAGVVVKLETGETGRCLRVWAPPLEARSGERLPSFNAEPAPLPEHKKWRLKDDQVDRAAEQVLGEADLDFMIEQRAQGLQGDALRKFGIRSEDLEKKAKDLLRDVDDDELERRMGLQ
jgi:uncharacterized repeat protein (TIGR03833 family)